MNEVRGHGETHRGSRDKEDILGGERMRVTIIRHGVLVGPWRGDLQRGGRGVQSGDRHEERRGVLVFNL